MRMILVGLAVLTMLAMGGCSAMMLGGGSGKQYPPANECPEGQTRTEEGCKA